MKSEVNFLKMNKNMKKIGLYMLGAAMLFTSCDSILNGDPDDSFTKDNYFTSENNVKLFANEFFGEFAGYDGAMTTAINAVNSYEANFYYACLSDDQASTGTENWLFKTAPATSAVWNNAYTQIRRANTILEQLPKIEALTEAQRNNWEGVARLMRAWHHYKLVRNFGNVYWVDKVLSTADGDVLYGARTDRKVVMDNVLEDVNFAVANIATEKSATDWSKSLANAMKSEICLYEAGYSKYTLNDASRANKFYGEVKTACEAIFAMGYELSNDYKALFNSPDLAANNEVIFFKKYLWGQLAHSLVDYTCGSTQTHGMSKDAFDAYLGLDGNPVQGNDQGVIRHEVAADGHVAEDHDVIDISACLAVRDKRLAAAIDATLFFPGCGWQRFGGAESTSSTGYGVALFDNEELTTAAWGGNARRQSIGGNDTDAPIYWLSLIKLNYAEACVETGDDASAKAAINEIRAAHSNIAAFTSGDVKEAVRLERRVEMMFCKNDRYWSLIRWNELEKLDTKKHPNVNRGAYVKGILPAEVLAQVTVDADGYINCKGDGIEREYDAKHNLFPIPSGEITLNPEIGQNPGW